LVLLLLSLPDFLLQLLENVMVPVPQFLDVVIQKFVGFPYAFQ
jgi:hypothetical protein